MRALALLLLCGCTQTVKLTADNDIFKLSKNFDRYYSHGTELAIEGEENAVGVGQKIITPDDKWATELIKEDRPYAGYLYGFYRRDIPMSRLRTWSFRAESGIVGPSARAGDTQNFIHDLLGQAEFHGWDNQLRDEPVLNLYARHTWHHWYDDPVGLDTFIEGAAGNLLTAGTAGTRLRWRYDHGDWWGLLFWGFEGQAKARDIFLDGNTWKDSHSVDKYPFVGAAVSGLCVGYGKAFFGYVICAESKQFEGQPAGHSFGSVRFGYGERCE